MTVRPYVQELIARMVGKAGCGDPIEEAQARLFATGIFEKYAEWVEAEVARQTRSSIIVSVTTHFAVGMSCVPFSDPEVALRARPIAELIGREFSHDLLEIAERAGRNVTRIFAGFPTGKSPNRKD
jgi:hypothetical protein